MHDQSPALPQQDEVSQGYRSPLRRPPDCLTSHVAELDIDETAPKMRPPSGMAAPMNLLPAAARRGDECLPRRSLAQPTVRPTHNASSTR